ncbi:MAG TPA: hypothetical protein VK348_14885, partial [Planctomycetota bacterium]|nr:hypothetical protein [Planctomycetota bacterium]
MQRRTVFWCVAVVAAVTAAGWAWSLRWTCDDAYISFRYADHLVGGHGLVFNLDPNEAPVEGYTNFAWTMLLALGIAVGNGGDALEGWASALGSLCHAATVLVLAWAAWRAGGGRMLLPAAGI